MKRKRFSTAVLMAGTVLTTDQLCHGQTYTQLAALNGSNGSTITSGLVADSSGNLYGDATYGGGSGLGVVFELSGANYSTLTTLAAFNGSSNGSKPFGSLYIDGSGNLFGTTSFGGANNQGTVFELSGTNHSAFSTLVTFNTSSGTNPFAGLTADSSGNLYGTTESGTAAGMGTVFELSGPAHTTLTTLVSFSGSNGGFPQTGLTFDPNSGNLYGTTAGGGTGGDGTVFKLSGVNHTTETVLANFNGPNGSFPLGEVTIGPDANLYGTTAQGGNASDGTLYRLSGTSLQTLTTLTTFNQSSGTTPESKLAFDSAGNLFATTSNGTAGGNGSVFELTGNNYQNLRQVILFRTGNVLGSGPRGPLYSDGTGNLYGTTQSSGEPFGSAFSYNGTAYQLSGSGFVVPTAPVNASGTTPYTLPAAPPSSNALFVDALKSLTVSQGGTVYVPFAQNHSGKQIVYLPVPGHILNISSGRLNLTNNDAGVSTGGTNSGSVTFMDQSGTNIAAATSATAAGYNNGNWNGGNGVLSSAAAADTTHTTAVGVIQNNQSGSPVFSSSNQFDGVTPGPGDILFKYTYYGDANLDGQVDGSDYTLIDTGYKSGGTSTGWYYGDFNYDGVIDGSDYSLIDNSFNNQGPNLSTAAIAAGPTGLTAGPAAAVPEPAGEAALLAAAAGILRRRRWSPNAT